MIDFIENFIKFKKLILNQILPKKKRSKLDKKQNIIFYFLASKT